MSKWLARGLVFAAAMVVLRLFQGALINAFQTQAGIISVVLLLLFIIGVVVWGVIDGRGDARANPDPDRRGDLAMVWLLAGLVAGVLGGVVAWLISLFYDGGLYAGSLINEVTTFAAFTALVVFLSGIVGVFVARWRVDRKAPPPDRRGGGGDDRADTDVFDAVHEDETPTGETAAASGRQHEETTVGGEQNEERTSAVATAEGERPTQVAPASRGDEETTQSLRTDDRTQAGPTTADAEKTQAFRKPTEDQR